MYIMIGEGKWCVHYDGRGGGGVCIMIGEGKWCVHYDGRGGVYIMIGEGK